VVFSTTKKLALTLIAAMALGMAQEKPAEKVAKDQAEADLINSIPKEADAAKRVAILDKWTKDYPDTAFASERTAEYLRAYSDLKDCRGQDKIAAEMLAKDPTSEPGLRIIIGCIYQIKGPSAAEFDQAEKAANTLLANADKIYSDANKPAATPAAAWQQFKATMVIAAENTIPYIDLQRKDDVKAESDLKKLLQSDPSDAQASSMLATLLFGQRAQKPENQPPAIFEYARVGVYDGPNALDAKSRAAFLSTAAKYYKAYHGSDEGWDKIVALAKANSLPPADFAIKSTADLAAEAAAAEAAADAADPVFAIWKTIKGGLTGDGDAGFFESSVKAAGLPSPDGSKKFKGKLVSQKPALNPKTLVVSYKDPAGDITLQLETPLRGKMDPGAELEFYGEATAYTKAPFMLTLKIADPKTDIVGWKSLPIAPTPAKKTGAAATKKGQ
jgi:hypothetical protein